MNHKYILTAILVMVVFSGTASAWLTGYDYRMSITVDNGGTSNLSYYQFNFTNDTNVLVSAGNMQASGADCRITDASDNLLPFWNETPFNAAGTNIWVNATTLAVGDNTFYMYYGNAGASSVTNGDNTFNFFDDFVYNETPLWNGTADTIFSGDYDGETSIVVEGDTAHCWVASGSDHESLEYSYANDSKCAVYTQFSGNPIMTNIRFPEVIKEGDTYYLFAHNTSIDGTVGDVYLWNSTDKTNWTIMNDGNPVLENSTNTSAWNYAIANVAVQVVDGRWHMLTECMYDGAGFWRGGYTYSNLTELNWTKRLTVISESMSCPDLVYVPDRNALMALASTGDSALTMKSYHASLSDNLSLSSSWHDDGSLGLGDNVADGMFAVVGSNKENNIIFQHYPQGGPTYQSYSNLSLDAFYDRTLVDSLADHWTGDTSYASCNGGVLSYTGDGITWRHIYSDVNMTPDMAMRCRANLSTFDDGGQQIGFEKTPCCDGRSIVFDTGLLTTDDTGTNEATSGLLNAATWYTFDILQISGTSVELLADGVSKVTHTAHVGTIAEPANIASTSGVIDVDWLFTRDYSLPEPAATLGAEETAAGGCGAYNITLPLGWSIIGWTNPTASTAHSMGTLIGANCTFVSEYNATTGYYTTHNMGGPESTNSFMAERGYGYWVKTSAETLWERDS